jgi:hypothetical protein
MSGDGLLLAEARGITGHYILRDRELAKLVFTAHPLLIYPLIHSLILFKVPHGPTSQHPIMGIQFQREFQRE